MNDLAIDLRDVAKTYGDRSMRYGASRCRLRQARSSACGTQRRRQGTFVENDDDRHPSHVLACAAGCFAVVIFERRSALLGEPSGGSIPWSYPPRGEG